MQRRQPNLSDFPPPPISELHPQEGAVVSGGFTEDEVQNLRDIFDLFDKERQGHIDVKDLEAIMTSLQRDPVEARGMLGSAALDGGSVSFEEFIHLMQQVENKLMVSNHSDAPSSIKKEPK